MATKKKTDTELKKRKTKSKRLGWFGLAVSLIWVVLIGFVAPAMSANSPLTLTGIVPPLLLAALPVFFFLTCLIGRGRLWLFHFIPLGLTPFLILDTAVGNPLANAENTLNVMTLNTHGGQIDYNEMAAYVNENDIRVLFLEETNGVRGDITGTVLKYLKGWHVTKGRECAILTKAPHGEPTVKKVPGKLNREVVSVKLLGTTLAAMHWPAPQVKVRPDKIMSRLEESDAERVPWRQESTSLAERNASVVLAGDFNTPARHPDYALLSKHYENAFGKAGIGTGWTYSFYGQPAIRIDHIWSRGFTAQKAWVGPSFGSDHFSVVAKLKQN